MSSPTSTISMNGFDGTVPSSDAAAVKKSSPTSPKPRKKPLKRRSWRKPADKPKRPLSAYNLFFQAERVKIIRSIEEVDSGCSAEGGEGRKTSSRGKIGFARLAQNIANKWNNLDSESRSVFESQAETEKRRYRVELEAWQKSKKAEAEKVVATTSGAATTAPKENAAQEKTPAKPRVSTKDTSRQESTSRPKESPPAYHEIGAMISRDAPVDDIVNKVMESVEIPPVDLDSFDEDEDEELGDEFRSLLSSLAGSLAGEDEERTERPNPPPMSYATGTIFAPTSHSLPPTTPATTYTYPPTQTYGPTQGGYGSAPPPYFPFLHLPW